MGSAYSLPDLLGQGGRAVGSGLRSVGRFLASGSPLANYMAEQEAAQAIPDIPQQAPAPWQPRPIGQTAPRPLAIQEEMQSRVQPPPQNDLSGLQAGQFQGRPGFNSSVGGAAPTANQLGVDTDARSLLEAKYAGEDEATQGEAARRGDPRRLAIEAAMLDRAYEDTRPYGSTSSIGASYGEGWGDLSGSEVGSDGAGERDMGLPTIGQARDLQMAERQSLLKNMPQMRELELRQKDSEWITVLRKTADDLVEKGRDPKQVSQWYADQERMLLQELTAAAGQNLGFFNNQ